MSLAFLSKKGFHTATLRNQERVWKAEQAKADEDRKLAELRKEIEDERQVEELRQMQESAGLVKRSERLDWMYEVPGGGPSAEDYLMGKAAELPKGKEDVKAANSSSAPGALWLENAGAEDPVAAHRDLQAKVKSDPLLMIKQKEKDSLKRILDNPVKMQMLRRARDEMKRDRKKRHKHRHSSSSKHERGGESDSEKKERREEDRSRRHRSRREHRSRGDSPSGDDRRHRSSHRHRSRAESSSGESRRRSRGGSSSREDAAEPSAKRRRERAEPGRSERRSPAETTREAASQDTVRSSLSNHKEQRAIPPPNRPVFDAASAQEGKRSYGLSFCRPPPASMRAHADPQPGSEPRAAETRAPSAPQAVTREGSGGRTRERARPMTEEQRQQRLAAMMRDAETHEDDRRRRVAASRDRERREREREDEARRHRSEADELGFLAGANRTALQDADVASRIQESANMRQRHATPESFLRR